MPAPVRLIAIASLALLVLSGTALAQTVVATATKWGLLGTWQLDCGAPVSRSNAALKYVVRGGKLFHDRDFGDGTKDSSAITAAGAGADGTFELTVPFASISQTRQFAFIKGADGRIRVLRNRNVDTDEYSIKDGKFVANGNASPWQSRCSKATN